MSTSSRSVRRGLPRIPGGSPWPPSSEGPHAAPAQQALGAIEETAEPTSAAVAPVAAPVVSAHTGAGEVPAAIGGMASVRESDDRPPSVSAAAGEMLRRGLPRVSGGAPWPPAGHAPVKAVPAFTSEGAPEAQGTASSTAPGLAADAAGRRPDAGPRARRGLPRVAEGASRTAFGDAAGSSSALPGVDGGGAPAPTNRTAGSSAAEPVQAVPVASSPAVEAGASTLTPAASGELRTTPPVRLPNGVATSPTATKTAARQEPRQYGPYTLLQLVGGASVAAIALVALAAAGVSVVRWFLSLPVMVDFLTTYPGEYRLPADAPVGLPAWLGWQHFFNAFLIVLIIRSGLQVRREKRPVIHWSPRKNSKRKISLTLWFHQSLDILWLVNGAVFVVLLFTTGQWMRIIPTSLEVFPNAISAALQYLSLDWPTENGWVNYNSLQQIAYFLTVFVAAPLAALTGVRMSGVWPTRAKTLSRLYPIEWARRTHFPIMIYFVAFIVVHVGLVFATGALRNLNHVYAAQGSENPTAYSDNWTGFWIFVASLAVMAGAWFAARPLLLAPIARLFGNVGR